MWIGHRSGREGDLATVAIWRAREDRILEACLVQMFILYYYARGVKLEGITACCHIVGASGTHSWQLTESSAIQIATALGHISKGVNDVTVV